MDNFINFNNDFDKCVLKDKSEYTSISSLWLNSNNGYRTTISARNDALRSFIDVTHDTIRYRVFDNNAGTTLIDKHIHWE